MAAPVPPCVSPRCRDPLGGHRLVQPGVARPFDPFVCLDCGWVFVPPLPTQFTPVWPGTKRRSA